MKYYIVYDEPDESNPGESLRIMTTRDRIIASRFDDWKARLTKFIKSGKNPRFSNQELNKELLRMVYDPNWAEKSWVTEALQRECVEDFMVVHWAWEVCE